MSPVTTVSRTDHRSRNMALPPDLALHSRTYLMNADGMYEIGSSLRPSTAGPPTGRRCHRHRPRVDCGLDRSPTDTRGRVDRVMSMNGDDGGKGRRAAHRLSLDRIAEAQRVIDPVFTNTPQYECDALSDELGCRLTLKVEVCNPIRCFKGRGADYFLTRATARGDERPLVCASAGNFGQALAYVCRKHARSLTVFAAVSASPVKVERMRALGRRRPARRRGLPTRPRRRRSGPRARPAPGWSKTASSLRSPRERGPWGWSSYGGTMSLTRLWCRSATARC